VEDVSFLKKKEFHTKRRFVTIDTPFRGPRYAATLMSVRRIAKIGCFHSFE
jgi:hypothetical protein